MGCGCGKRAATTSGTAESSLYKVVLPSGETKEVLTAYEARREVRLAGGGTITRMSA